MLQKYLSSLCYWLLVSSDCSLTIGFQLKWSLARTCWPLYPSRMLQPLVLTLVFDSLQWSFGNNNPVRDKRYNDPNSGCLLSTHSKMRLPKQYKRFLSVKRRTSSLKRSAFSTEQKGNRQTRPKGWCANYFQEPNDNKTDSRLTAVVFLGELLSLRCRRWR